MQKLYEEIDALAGFIAKQESTDFETLWDMWSREYKPEQEHVVTLRKIGAQLCQIEKGDIRGVPAYAYKNKIQGLMPKEETENGGTEKL